jgi:hypothetical protein
MDYFFTVCRRCCHGRSTLINRHSPGACGDGERVPKTALSKCNKVREEKMMRLLDYLVSAREQ